LFVAEVLPMFRSLFRRVPPSPPAIRSFKPRLEALEGREVPAAPALTPLGAELTQLFTDLSAHRFAAVPQDIVAIERTVIGLLSPFSVAAQVQFGPAGQAQFSASAQVQFGTMGQAQVNAAFQGLGSLFSHPPFIPPFVRF
jgi:hypothetical protein